MPGLPKCRHMQERVAIVALEGKKSVALDGIEPLYPTTQLNRPDVPAWLSLLGRHYSTIPCCYAEILAVRQAGATICERLWSSAGRKVRPGEAAMFGVSP